MRINRTRYHGTAYGLGRYSTGQIFWTDSGHISVIFDIGIRTTKTQRINISEVKRQIQLDDRYLVDSWQHVFTFT